MSESKRLPRKKKGPNPEEMLETEVNAEAPEDAAETTGAPTDAPQENTPEPIVGKPTPSKDIPRAIELPEEPKAAAPSIKAGEIQPIPSLQAQLESKAQHAQTAVWDGLRKIWGKIRGKWIILEVAAAVAIGATAVHFLTKEKEPEKPSVKLEEIMDMANSLKPYNKISERFEEQIPATEKAEMQNRLLLDVLNPGAAGSGVRWLLVGLPEKKSLYLVESRNKDLIRLLDEKRLRIGTKVEIEILPIEKEKGHEKLVETAKEKNAMPGILKKISVIR